MTLIAEGAVTLIAEGAVTLIAEGAVTLVAEGTVARTAGPLTWSAGTLPARASAWAAVGGAGCPAIRLVGR